MTTFSRNSELTPAYILHTRKYRDTSLIAELLTQREGRVAVVIRGARGGKKKTGVVQPFTPLLVSYIGRGELKTVTHLEATSINPLKGENLFIGLYVNELMVRLLGKFEVVPAVFNNYQQLLITLLTEDNVTHILRQFEFTLLNDLGYGITFDLEATNGRAIEAERLYHYVPDEGFHVASDVLASTRYQGQHLLQIAKGDFSSLEVENCAKKIVRASITALLGAKPLKSREMFKQYQELMMANQQKTKKDK